MPKRAVRLLAALCLIGGFAAVSCSCSGGRENDRTVELWTLQLSPTFDAYMTDLLAEFERRNPGVRVRWVDVPYEGITQRLLSAIAAGSAPDVVNLPADFVLKYARLGALASLDGLLPDSVRDGYMPASCTPLVVEGSMYAVPWYLATKILIYDSLKILRAGLRPPPPCTFTDMLAYARAYATNTGRPAFFYNVAQDSYLLQTLASEGVPLLSPDGQRATFDTPGAARIVDEWVSAFRAGALPREALLQGHRGGLDLYQSGVTAWFIGAPQFLRIVRENAPGIYAHTGVARAPVGEAGKTELDVMALAVCSSSRVQEEAVRLSTFVTDAGNQLAFSRLVPVFPSALAALDDSLFRTEGLTLESRARYIGAEQLRRAEVLRPAVPDYQRLQETFKEQMLKVFLGRRSAREALSAAALTWTRILQEQPR